MMYELYDTAEGIVKIYEKGIGYYLDINNKYDKEIKTKTELDKYLKSVKAQFAGIDED